MKRLLFLFALLTTTLAVQARLGETPAEIEKRYGTLSSEQYPGGLLYGLPSTNYVFKGMFISVSFKDGKSVREAVSPLANRDMPLSERNSFVKAVGGSKFGQSADGRLWIGPQGARATYQHGMLRIQSGEFSDFWDAYQRKQSHQKSGDEK